MKKLVKWIVREILWLLPNEIAHKILYKHVVKKKLDLNNPKDFNEKIQYLMLYKYGKRETELADKYLVRKYVKNRGYEDLLPKLYHTYKDVNEININDLPDKFVLKTNHSSGTVVICKDKKTFDLESAKRKIRKCLKSNYAKQVLEYHYSDIDRLIICEEYIEPELNNLMPEDYKIYCFDGKAECTLVCSEREEKLKLDYYDLQWKYLNYSTEEYKSNKIIEKPKDYEKMIKIAEDLSKGLPYARVDLYNVDGKIYFGEITLTPAAACITYNTQEALDYLGSLINIE